MLTSRLSSIRRIDSAGCLVLVVLSRGGGSGFFVTVSRGVGGEIVGAQGARKGTTFGVSSGGGVAFGDGVL